MRPVVNPGTFRGFGQAEGDEGDWGYDEAEMAAMEEEMMAYEEAAMMEEEMAAGMDEVEVPEEGYFEYDESWFDPED